MVKTSEKRQHRRKPRLPGDAKQLRCHLDHLAGKFARVLRVRSAMRELLGVLLIGFALTACGGETDGSLHSPAAGDPNDPHYKRGGDPITFVHVVDDGSEVVVNVSHGPGDGSFVDTPPGWRFVAFVGAESKEVVDGKASFGRDFVGKTDPVRVELHRPDRAVTVFDVVPPPAFEEPHVAAKSVTIGSSVAVELTPIVGLPSDAFECSGGSPCTFLMLSADGLCISWDSSVHFFRESPESFSRPRVVDLPIIQSEFSDGPCTGKIAMTAARTTEWPDGNIYFGRERGPAVAFTR
jgi:hypothetical protein